MQPEDSKPTVEPTATTGGATPEDRSVREIGLVRDNSYRGDPASEAAHVEDDLTPDHGSPTDSHPEASDATDNVVRLDSRRSGGYLPLVTVCLAVVTSLALLLVDFRLGTVGLAASVGLALALRAVLPDKRAGLLVVRTRTFDLWFLSVLAVALTLLAAIVPVPPK